MGGGVAPVALGRVLCKAYERVQALPVQVLVPWLDQGDFPCEALCYQARDKFFTSFTIKKLHITDEYARVHKLKGYLRLLGISHYTYKEACKSQKLEDFIQCIENALWFYGGVPRTLVTDNLKSVVTKSNSYEPKDKSIEENAVRIVYTKVLPLYATTPSIVWAISTGPS